MDVGGWNLLIIEYTAYIHLETKEKVVYFFLANLIIRLFAVYVYLVQVL